MPENKVFERAILHVVAAVIAMAVLVANAAAQGSHRHITFRKYTETRMRLQTQAELLQFFSEYEEVTGKGFDDNVLTYLQVAAMNATVDVKILRHTTYKPISHEPRRCTITANGLDQTCMEMWTYQNVPSVVAKGGIIKTRTLRWMKVYTDSDGKIEAEEGCLLADERGNRGVMSCLIYMDQNYKDFVYQFMIGERGKEVTADILVEDVSGVSVFRRGER